MKPMYTTLISPAELQALQQAGQATMVFDCSFELMKPEAGEKLYQDLHIAGAVYANLDTALSEKGGGPVASGGRHPLPTREAFAEWLRSAGFSSSMQAVVYDRNGANYCGRLWWMLKWAGHDAVAVLDGGLQAWQAAGGAVESGVAATGGVGRLRAGDFTLGAPLRRLVSAAEVMLDLGRSGQTLVDARATPRFKGETEPLDPVAGHIPGALNRPFGGNLGPDGRFKPTAQLRAEFDALLGGRDPASVVHHCGSGVSAIPNLIGMELAGFAPTALFAGSWSEWCADPARPVAQG